MADIGTSKTELVPEEKSTSEEKKIPLHRHSKIAYFLAFGTLGIAVGFMVATGLLVNEVNRVREINKLLEKEFKSVDEKFKNISKAEPVCMTRECITSAAALIDAMDETIDPCDDFYQFACGGWVKKHAIPRGQESVSQFGILADRVEQQISIILQKNSTNSDTKAINVTRDFYKSCIDAGTIEVLGVSPLVKLLDSFGSWPIVNSKWNEENFELFSTVALIRKSIDEGLLLNVFNYMDANDTELNIIYVDQPELGIPRSVLRGDKSSENQKAYSDFIYNSAMALREYLNSSIDDIDPANVLLDAQNLVIFHGELSDIMNNDIARPYWNKTYMYNLMSLTELQELVEVTNSTNNQINWNRFLNDVYNSVNITIESDEKVVVIEPDYVRKLSELIAKTPRRVLANYLGWRVVLKVIPYTNKNLRSIANDFWRFLYGPSKKPGSSRATWCQSQVNDLMGFAISSEFVKDIFREDITSDVGNMIGQIKVAFASLVEELTWLDYTTKVKALEKLNAIRDYIAYPEWILNVTVLERAYGKMEIKSDRFLESFINISRDMISTNLKFLRFRTDRNNKWITVPTIVNAFHAFWLNSINLPAAILQPPFYEKGRLAAFNYGGIGMVIGHEITHGFDHRGSKYDKNGHQVSWWTDSSLDEFVKRKQCVIDQYTNFSFPHLDTSDTNRINGTKTQGENIADNGGVRQAFRAFQNHMALFGRDPILPGLERYSPEQIFFLSFANIWCGQQTPDQLRSALKRNVHSPARFRVIGTVSNSVDFAKHFKCPADSPMNPEEKCVIW